MAKKRKLKNNGNIVFHIERRFIEKGFAYLIGVDEVGRGPLAGPVLSCAASLKVDNFDETISSFKAKIDDSKKLSENLREKAYGEILSKIDISIGICSPRLIDTMNILEATKNSMVRALNRLSLVRPQLDVSNTLILIDGNIEIDTPFPVCNVVDGDSRCFLISCASIVAKVVRDEIMKAYNSIYPHYDFLNNKGYGTKRHMEAIKKCGITPIHRKTFSPCKL